MPFVRVEECEASKTSVNEGTQGRRVVMGIVQEDLQTTAPGIL